MISTAILAAAILAASYTLLALSWVIVFRSSGLVNFATGEFMLLGGYLMWEFRYTVGLPFALSAVLALAISGVLGVILYWISVKRLAGEELYSPVLVTFGVAIIIRGIMGMVWGGEVFYFQVSDDLKQTINLAPSMNVQAVDLVIVVVAVAIWLALLALLKYTRTGVEMRAAAENAILAGQSGMSINMIFSLGFALGLITAAVAGIAHGYSVNLTPSVTELGLAALVPAMLGGLDSVKGVVAGAVLVALVESFGVLYISPDAREIIVYSVLLAVLLVQPQGLFGRMEVRRV